MDGFWRAGLCCSGSVDVDDVEFLHDLRALLIEQDGVDLGRVIAVGLSNGGMLSYAWACSRPGDLAAIGIVAGTLGVDCPDPAPVTVVAVHGSRTPYCRSTAGRRRYPAGTRPWTGR